MWSCLESNWCCRLLVLLKFVNIFGSSKFCAGKLHWHASVNYHQCDVDLWKLHVATSSDTVTVNGIHWNGWLLNANDTYRVKRITVLSSAFSSSYQLLSVGELCRWVSQNSDCIDKCMPSGGTIVFQFEWVFAGVWYFILHRLFWK